MSSNFAPSYPLSENEVQETKLFWYWNKIKSMVCRGVKEEEKKVKKKNEVAFGAKGKSSRHTIHHAERSIVH